MRCPDDLNASCFQEFQKTGRRRQVTVCERSDADEREAVCAESFQVLAKSLRRPDDPARLFGEIPTRRRYQTGGDVTKARDLRMLTE